MKMIQKWYAVCTDIYGLTTEIGGYSITELMKDIAKMNANTGMKNVYMYYIDIEVSE